MEIKAITCTTVRELIEALSKFPGEAKLVIGTGDDTVTALTVEDGTAEAPENDLVDSVEYDKRRPWHRFGPLVSIEGDSESRSWWDILDKSYQSTCNHEYQEAYERVEHNGHPGWETVRRCTKCYKDLEVTQPHALNQGPTELTGVTVKKYHR